MTVKGLSPRAPISTIDSLASFVVYLFGFHSCAPLFHLPPQVSGVATAVCIHEWLHATATSNAVVQGPPFAVLVSEFWM